MVFRKPYGFLIKHFKLIHLVLTGLLIYLTSYVSGILTYYNKFMVGTVGKFDAINYMNSYYLIAVILSIIICMVVYALLRYKKKPRTLYLVLIAFVILIAGFINMVQGGLEVIYFGVLDTKTLRLYRDLLRILIVFQYISVAVVLVRGLGFDIKKFDFVADLHELDLDVSDDEEVELTIGNTNILQRKVNRRVREFKYYYFENKPFILVIVISLLVIGLGSWIINKEVVNKVYEEGEQFSTDNFTFKVLDSYITTRGYDNEVILKDNSSYVIVKTMVSSNNKSVINMANMLLNVNYNSYSSNSYSGNRFMDLGTPYRKQKVNGAYTYLFIYKVSNNDINKKMHLVYADDKKVKLSPVMLDEAGTSKEYKLDEKIDLSKTTFDKGSFVIESYEVGEKFSYPYQYEMGGKIFNSQYSITSPQKMILKLDVSSEIPLDLNNYTFLDYYASLKYKIDGVEYESNSFEDKTPGNEKKSLYLSVDKKIGNAEEIWFDIQIRNYKFIYKIK